eukprot:127814-Ditylum_brightwellii.AAC.1
MKAALVEEMRLTLEESWKKWNENKNRGKMLVPSFSPMSIGKIYPAIILKSMWQSSFFLIWDGR